MDFYWGLGIGLALGYLLKKRRRPQKTDNERED